jgi:hypothetical protein
MKALVYEKAHSLADFAIKLVEIPVPTFFTSFRFMCYSSLTDPLIGTSQFHLFASSIAHSFNRCKS